MMEGGEEEEPKNMETLEASSSWEDNGDKTIEIPEPEPFEHDWEAGDHIIRWEMLPIAWPIQIHAIILEATEVYVKIVDFGLTALPGQPHGEGDDDETQVKKKNDILHKYLVKPLEKKKKDRLNIRILTTQAELKPWSKVNYNGGLFGMGGDKKKKKKWMSLFGKKTGGEVPTEESPATEGQESEGAASVEGIRKSLSDAEVATVATSATEDGAAKEQEEKKEEGSSKEEDEGASAEEKPPSPEKSKYTTPAWMMKASNLNTSKMFGGEQQEGGKPPSPGKGKFMNMRMSMNTNWMPSTGKLFASSSTSGGSEQQQEGQQEGSEKRQSTLTSKIMSPSEWFPSKAIGSEQKEGQEDGEEKPPSPLKTKFMNPAMAKLMKGRKGATPSSSPKSGLSKEATKRLSKLPKDDPAMLVLSRVEFLLLHGEEILPKYNPFHSNSETIAVWCKTGQFRTIQADVFLHSTAVGNGKSATAIALGVAATSGIAAAGVAGIGVAAMVAPWWYLKHSKDKCGDATTILNDAYWAQAPPEVFVECIEKWAANQQEETDEAEVEATGSAEADAVSASLAAAAAASTTTADETVTETATPTN